MVSLVKKLTGKAVDYVTDFILSPKSPLHKVLNFTNRVDIFVQNVTTFHNRAKSVTAFIKGPIMSFPKTMREAANTVMTPVRQVVASLEKVQRVKDSMERQLSSVTSFGDAVELVKPLLKDLADKHLGNYSGVAKGVINNLGAIETVVQTIDGVLKGDFSNLSIDKLKDAILSYMRAVLPNGKQGVLSEGTDSSKLIQTAAMERLTAMLDSYSEQAGQDSAIGKATAAVSKALSLIDTAKSVGAQVMSVIDGTQSPITVALDILKANLGDEGKEFISNIEDIVAGFTAALSSEGSVLDKAASLAKDALDGLLSESGGSMIPDALSTVTDRLSGSFGDKFKEVADFFVNLFKQVADVWENEAVQSGLRQLLMPVIESDPLGDLAQGETPSIFSDAVRNATAIVQFVSNDLLDAVKSAALGEVGRVRALLPDVDGAIGDAVRAVLTRAASEFQERVPQNTTILGVRVVELQWDAVAGAVRSFGTPALVSQALDMLDELGDALADNLAGSALDTLATAFDYAASAAAQAASDAAREQRVLSAATVAAHTDIHAMNDAVRDLRLVLEINVDRTFHESLKNGLATQLLAAVQQIVQLAPSVLAVDNDAVDAYFEGGMAAVREVVPVDTLVRIAESVGAVSTMADGIASCVNGIDSIGSVLSNHMAAATATARAAGQSFVPNLDAMAESVSSISVPDVGLITSVVDTLVDTCATPMRDSFVQAAKHTAAALAKQDFNPLTAAAKSCAAQLRTEMERHATPPRQLATLNAAVRQVWMSAVGVVGGAQGGQLPSNAQARDTAQAVSRVVDAVGIVAASEYSSLLQANTACGSLAAAAEVAVWPAVAKADKLMRHLYEPIARTGLVDTAKTLIEKLSSVSSLDDIIELVDSVLAEVVEVGLSSVDLTSFGPDISSSLTQAQGLQAELESLSQYIDSLSHLDFLARPVHANVRDALSCVARNSNVVQAAINTLPTTIEDATSVNSTILTAALSSLGDAAVAFPACLDLATIPLAVNDVGERVVSQYCANTTELQDEEQQVCSVQPVVDFAESASCNSTNTSSTNSSCTETVCYSHIVQVNKTVVQCNPYITLAGLLADAGLADLEAGITELASTLQSVRMLAAAASQVDLLRHMESGRDLVQQVQAAAQAVTAALSADDPQEALAVLVLDTLYAQRHRIGDALRLALSKLSPSFLATLHGLGSQVQAQATAAQSDGGVIAQGQAAVDAASNLATAAEEFVAAVQPILASNELDPLVALAEENAQTMANIAVKFAAANTAVVEFVDLAGSTVSPAAAKMANMMSRIGSVVIGASHISGAFDSMLTIVEAAKCLFDAGTAAHDAIADVVSGDQASPLDSSQPLDSRLAWLRSTLVPAVECVENAFPGAVDAATVRQATSMASVALQAWDIVSSVSIPSSPAAAATVLDSIVQRVIQVLQDELAYLYNVLDGNAAQDLADRLLDVVTTIPTLFDDDGVRRDVELCEETAESHVVMVAAHARALAAEVLPHAQAAATSLSDSSTVDGIDAVGVYAMLPGVVQALQNAVNVSMLDPGVISARDSRNVTSLTPALDSLLSGLAAAASALPLGGGSSTFISQLVTQMLRSRSFIDAIKAVTAVVKAALKIPVGESPTKTVNALKTLGSRLESAVVAFNSAPAGIALLRDLHSDLVLHSNQSVVHVYVARHLTRVQSWVPVAGVEVAMLPSQLRSAVTDAMDILINAPSVSAWLKTKALAVRAAMAVGSLQDVIERVKAGLAAAESMSDMVSDMVTSTTKTAQAVAKAVTDPFSGGALSSFNDLEEFLEGIETGISSLIDKPAQLIMEHLRRVGSDAEGGLRTLLHHLRHRDVCAASTASACARMHAAGDPPAWCCSELVSLGLEHGNCPVVDCVALATASVSNSTNSSAVPSSCCATLRASGIAHESCPVADCASIVALHDPSQYASDSPPDLPVQCCFDAATKDTVANHPVCQPRTGCARCGLARMTTLRYGSWSVRRRLSSPIEALTAELDSALDDLESEVAELLSQGIEAATDEALKAFAKAAATAATVVEAHSGAVSQFDALIGAGYGRWLEAVDMLTAPVQDAIAAVASHPAATFTAALDVAWPFISSQATAAGREAAALAVRVAWDVARAVDQGVDIPSIYVPLFAPASSTPNHESCTDSCSAAITKSLPSEASSGTPADSSSDEDDESDDPNSTSWSWDGYKLNGLSFNGFDFDLASSGAVLPAFNPSLALQLGNFNFGGVSLGSWSFSLSNLKVAISMPAFPAVGWMFRLLWDIGARAVGYVGDAVAMVKSLGAMASSFSSGDPARILETLGTSLEPIANSFVKQIEEGEPDDPVPGVKLGVEKPKSASKKDMLSGGSSFKLNLSFLSTTLGGVGSLDLRLGRIVDMLGPLSSFDTSLPKLGGKRLRKLSSEVGQLTKEIEALPESLKARAAEIGAGLDQHLKWAQDLQSTIRKSRIVSFMPIVDGFVSIADSLFPIIDVVGDKVDELGLPSGDNLMSYVDFAADELAPQVSTVVSTIVDTLSNPGELLSAANAKWVNVSASVIADVTDGLWAALDICNAKQDGVPCLTDEQRRRMGVFRDLTKSIAGAAVDVLDTVVAAASTETIQVALRKLSASMSRTLSVWKGVAASATDTAALTALGVFDNWKGAMVTLCDAMEAIGLAENTLTVVEWVQDLNSPLQFVSEVMGLVSPGTFTSLQSGCDAMGNLGRGVEDVLAARGALLLASLQASENEDAKEVATMIASGTLAGSSSPLALAEVLGTMSGALSAGGLGLSSTATLHELRLRVVATMLASACNEVSVVVDMATESVGVVTAMGTVASRALAGNLAGAADAAVNDVAPAIQDVLDALSDPMVDGLASEGSAPLLQLRAVCSESLRGTALAVDHSACDAGGIAAGTCGDYTSFGVGASKTTLQESCKQLLQVVDASMLETVPSVPDAMYILDPSLLASALGRDSLRKLLGVASSVRWAVDSIVSDLGVSAAEDAVPGLLDLSQALDQLGVRRVAVVLQPVLWAFDTVESFFSQVTAVGDAVSEMSSAVAAGLTGGGSIDDLIDTVEGSMKRLAAGVTTKHSPVHIVMNAMRMSVADALDKHTGGTQLLATSTYDALVALDTRVVQTVSSGAMALLSPADRNALLDAVAAAATAVSSDANAPKPLAAAIGAVRQSTVLGKVLAPMQSMVSSLLAFLDSDAVKAAQEAIAIIGIFADSDDISDAVEKVLSRYVDQVVPLATALATKAGSSLDAVVASAEAAVADMVANFTPPSVGAPMPNIPTITLGGFSQPSPWVVQQVEELQALLQAVPTELNNLGNALLDAIDGNTALGPIAGVLNGDQAMRLLSDQGLQDAVLSAAIFLKRIAASSEAASDNGAVLPEAVTRFTDLVNELFQLRCLASCDFDVVVTRALRTVSAASGVVSTLKDLFTNPNLNAVLTTGKQLLETAEASLVASATNALGSSAPVLSVLPTSSAGAGLVADAVAELEKAMDAGEVVATPEVQGYVAALKNLTVVLADTLNHGTFSGLRKLNRAFAAVRKALRAAGKHDTDPFEIESLRALGELNANDELASAAKVLQFYMQASESYFDDVIGSRAVSLVGAAISSLTVLANQAQSIANMEELSMTAFAAIGKSMAEDVSESLIKWLASLTVSELKTVTRPAITDAARTFNMEVDATTSGQAWGSGVQAALSDAYAKATAVQTVLGDAAALALPLTADSVYDAATGTDYDSLLKALSAWRKSLGAVVDAMELEVAPAQLDLADSSLGSAVQTAFAALEGVSDERFDLAPRAIANVGLIVSDLLTGINSLSDLILAGISTTTLSRRASTLLAKIRKRLLEAVMKQVGGIVSTFSSFVSDLSDKFLGAVPKVANPTSTGKLVQKMNGFLRKTTSFMQGASKVLVKAADAGDKAAAGVEKFASSIVGKVSSAIDTIRSRVKQADDIFGKVADFLDTVIYFMGDAEALETKANEMLTLIMTKIEEKVQLIVGTFDLLLDAVTRVENTVLTAIAQAKTAASDLTSRAQKLLFRMGGGALQKVSDAIDAIGTFLAQAQQKLDYWKEVAKFALEITAMLSDIDGAEKLQLGALTSALNSVISGITFVEAKVKQVQDIRDQVSNIFNEITDIKGHTQPFIDSVPAEAAAKFLFNKVRSVVNTVKSEALKLKKKLMSSITEFAEEAISAVVDVLVDKTAPIASALKDVRSAMDTARESVYGVFNLVDRKDFLAEAMGALRSILGVPRAAASAVRSFASTFLGGLPPGMDLIEMGGDALKAVSEFCAADFEDMPAFDALVRAGKAVAALANIKPAIAKMKDIASELKGLVSLSGVQDCVSGASCGLATIKARFDETTSMLNEFVDGILSLVDFRKGVAALDEGITAIGGCIARVPDAINKAVDFVKDFMAGRLENLVSGLGVRRRRLDVVDSALSSVISVAKQLDTRVMSLTDTVEGVLTRVNNAVSPIINVVDKGLSYAGSALSVLRSAVKWAKVLKTETLKVTSLKAKMNEYLDSINVVETLKDQLKKLTDLAEKFIRSIAIRSPGVWKKMVSKTKSLLSLMSKGRRTVISKAKVVLDFADIISQALGMGKLKAEMTPYNQLTYCSDDTKPADGGVCLRTNERSGFVYRNLIFPALYLRYVLGCMFCVGVRTTLTVCGGMQVLVRNDSAVQ